MFNGSFKLRGAGRLPGAVVICPFFCHSGTTYRAVLGHQKWFVPRVTGDWDSFGDRRDDVSSSLNPHGVAHADIFSGHLVGIVEGGTADGNPPDLNWS